jgi:hypothetical protein
MVEKNMPDRASAVTDYGFDEDKPDFGRLISALLEQNENYARQIERLTSTLATGLAERNGLRDSEVQLIREYDITRRQLAGPADDEANTVSPARIVSINPPAGKVGDVVDIHLRNAGPATRVGFTGADGGTVSQTPEPDARSATTTSGPTDRRARDQLVRCKVPAGAVTGPVTVITDRGDPTSTFDFVVNRKSYPQVAELDRLFARYRQEGQR